MKLTISKSELQRGLTRIQSIVEKRNSMPILANALLQAEDGKLEIAATDLEVGIRGSHDVEISKPGGLTVSAKKFFEIVRELPEESVVLEATQNSYLEIQCARSKFTLAGTSSEEYPTLPVFSPEKTVPVQSAVLSSMIERTMYAASADETRYNLNGVFLEVVEDTGKIRMAATDGHRLALVDRNLTSEVGGLSSGVIIPRKGLAELKRLVDEDDTDEIELAFEGNNGLARKGDVTLVMRLIEGEFPNYRQVIPTGTGTTLTLPVEEIARAVRRVALLSSERSRAVKLELADNQLVISSNNPDLGDAREEMDIEYGGEPLSIGFNAKYLQDALSATHGKEVHLTFQDDLSPAKVIPTDDPDTLAVVMPMRI